MHSLGLWLKDEIDDDELRQVAATVDESHPEVADQIREALETDEEMADYLRSAPEYVSIDMFEFWESLGIHMTPVHWSSPIPNVQKLSDDLWDGPSELPDIDLGIDDQLERLSTFESKYKSEYDEFPITEPSGDYSGFHVKNYYFEAVDAEIAYSMIREHEPECIIEIGGGNSTQVVDAALQRNDDDCEHIVIDPEPTKKIKETTEAKIVKADVQEVPTSVFESLGEDDVLFIDSSHVARIGSDALHEYLNIVPQLGDGVLVHAHDIFLPYEYPRPWVMQRRWFFNEQYLLRALLTNSSDYDVLWSTYYMHQQHSDLLEEAFDSYATLGSQYESTNIYGIPSSFWMRTTR